MTDIIIDDSIIDDSIDMFCGGDGAATLAMAVRAKLQEPHKRRKIAVGRRKPGEKLVIETEDTHAHDTETPA